MCNWINTYLRMQQFPTAPPNLNPSPIQLSKQPTGTSTRGTNFHSTDMTRQEKARGEVPGPDGRLEHAVHRSAAPSQSRQTSLINHSTLPY